MPRQPPTGSAIAPLHRNRDFVLFWTSQALSTTGSRASSIAYPLVVLAVFGSAASAGVVGFAQTLPFLVCFLPAGVIVDRFDRKRIMLGAEVLRFLAMASVVAALLTDRFALWHILIVAFIEGSAMVFFEVAEAAALPHIVAKEQLPDALARNQARQQTADLAGQPLGGVLFGLGRSIPFLFDAVSYVVSFVALLLIKPDFQEQRQRSSASMASDIGDGVRWLWRQPFLRALTVLVAASNFVISALLLTVIVKTQSFGASSAVVGFVLAAFGLGSLIGTSMAPRLQRRFNGRQIVVGTTAYWAAAVALLIPANSPLLVGLAFGAGAVVGPTFSVMVGKYRYALTPDALQGRVVSASRVVGWGSIPLGSVAAGFAIERFGEAATLLMLTAVMASVAVAALLLPSLRRDPLHDQSNRDSEDRSSNRRSSQS